MAQVHILDVHAAIESLGEGKRWGGSQNDGFSPAKMMGFNEQNE